MNIMKQVKYRYSDSMSTLSLLHKFIMKMISFVYT